MQDVSSKYDEGKKLKRRPGNSPDVKSKTANKSSNSAPMKNGFSIDLSNPESCLANINIKTIANDSTFSALPSYCQHKLISLLPKCDKVTSENGKLSLGNEALNNEFFTKACTEWRQRLTDGDFTEDTQQRLSIEMSKQLSVMDPWKLKHFESEWGGCDEKDKEDETPEELREVESLRPISPAESVPFVGSSVERDQMIADLFEVYKMKPSPMSELTKCQLKTLKKMHRIKTFAPRSRNNLCSSEIPVTSRRSVVISSTSSIGRPIASVVSSKPKVRNSLPDVENSIPYARLSKSSLRGVGSSMPGIKSSIPNVSSTVPSVRSSIPGVRSSTVNGNQKTNAKGADIRMNNISKSVDGVIALPVVDSVPNKNELVQICDRDKPTEARRTVKRLNISSTDGQGAKKFMMSFQNSVLPPSSQNQMLTVSDLGSPRVTPSHIKIQSTCTDPRSVNGGGTDAPFQIVQNNSKIPLPNTATSNASLATVSLPLARNDGLSVVSIPVQAFNSVEGSRVPLRQPAVQQYLVIPPGSLQNLNFGKIVGNCSASETNETIVLLNQVQQQYQQQQQEQQQHQQQQQQQLQQQLQQQQLQQQLQQVLFQNLDIGATKSPTPKPMLVNCNQSTSSTGSSSGPAFRSVTNVRPPCAVSQIPQMFVIGNPGLTAGLTAVGSTKQSRLDTVPPQKFLLGGQGLIAATNSQTVPSQNCPQKLLLDGQYSVAAPPKAQGQSPQIQPMKFLLDGQSLFTASNTQTSSSQNLPQKFVLDGQNLISIQNMQVQASNSLPQRFFLNSQGLIEASNVQANLSDNLPPRFVLNSQGLIEASNSQAILSDNLPQRYLFNGQSLIEASNAKPNLFNNLPQKFVLNSQGLIEASNVQANLSNNLPQKFVLNSQGLIEASNTQVNLSNSNFPQKFVLNSQGLIEASNTQTNLSNNLPQKFVLNGQGLIEASNVQANLSNNLPQNFLLNSQGLIEASNVQANLSNSNFPQRYILSNQGLIAVTSTQTILSSSPQKFVIDGRGSVPASSSETLSSSTPRFVVVAQSTDKIQSSNVQPQRFVIPSHVLRPPASAVQIKKSAEVSKIEKFQTLSSLRTLQLPTGLVQNRTDGQACNFSMSPVVQFLSNTSTPNQTIRLPSQAVAVDQRAPVGMTNNPGPNIVFLLSQSPDLKTAAGSTPTNGFQTNRNAFVKTSNDNSSGNQLCKNVQMAANLRSPEFPAATQSQNNQSLIKRLLTSQEFNTVIKKTSPR